jgi:secondary thiamine-phosphate synthase enzyme
MALIKRIKHVFKPTKLFTDLTYTCNDLLSLNSGGGVGMLNIFSRHTTLGLLITEDELLHFADVKSHLEQIAPKDKVFLHDNIDLRDVPCDEPINGHSHIQSLIFQPSISIPVDDGKLMLGKWQAIFAIDLDLEAEKTREIIITHTG